MRTDEMLKVQGIHDDLMAEIKRLRAEVNAEEDTVYACMRMLKNMKAENERLRDALKEITSIDPFICGYAGHMRQIACAAIKTDAEPTKTG